MQDEVNKRLGRLLVPAVLFSLYASSLIDDALYYILTAGFDLTGQSSTGDRVVEAIYGSGNIGEFFWSFVIVLEAGILVWFLARMKLPNSVVRPGEFSAAVILLAFVFMLLALAIDDIGFEFGQRSDLLGAGDESIYQDGAEYVFSPGLLPSDIWGGWIVAPICEELMYRGLLISVMLAVGWHPVIAVVVSSAIFGLVHRQYTAFYSFLVGLSGCLLGILRLQTGGLIAPILCHSMMNASITLMDIADLFAPVDAEM